MRGIALSIVLMGSLIKTAIRGEQISSNPSSMSFISILTLITLGCIIFGW